MLSLEAKRKNENCRLKYQYGITLEEYEELLEQQDHGCAICDTQVNKDGRKLYVDHDHNTGKVRGLLCHRCNYLIGMLEKTPNKILEVLAYLSRNAEIF